MESCGEEVFRPFMEVRANANPQQHTCTPAEEGQGDTLTHARRRHMLSFVFCCERLRLPLRHSGISVVAGRTTCRPASCRASWAARSRTEPGKLARMTLFMRSAKAGQMFAGSFLGILWYDALFKLASVVCAGA